ncbi:MAG: molybdopterin biosynthesis protein [Anaerolineaceae bacterium]|nr:molybdopterin biosynthesis protein [Anaerolineaceae bacterium]
MNTSVPSVGKPMSIYLRDIPLPVAQARFQEALKEAGLWRVLDAEEIPLDEKALGRVLAAPVWASLSSPHYHASAMDGFALSARDTSGAMPTAPIVLTCGSQAAYVDTGDPIPDWADAVIPIEAVEPLDETGQSSKEMRRPAAIRIRAGVAPWSHVRPMGEDIVATQLVLPAGQVLRPVDIGALAASGQDRLLVARKPRVAILPTGSELVPVGRPVLPGDIIEYNSYVLAAQVNAWGGEAVRYPITADNFDQICAQVTRAARTNDLVLINAGSSAGAEDYSARTIQALGELLVHGVAVRPGHPVILGMLGVEAGGGRKAPVIGVPGYPVSAALTGEIFVEPLLARWTGREAFQPQEVQARLTRKVTSSPGDTDYLRVAVGRVGERLLAAPLQRGAGVITSLVKADGIAIIPPGEQGLEAGALVTVRLYRSPDELEHTFFAIGSHDLTLDLLAQYLAEKGRRLASVNAGSLGGLVALRRGEAHLAGSHLLDPLTGEYNLSYIRQYLPGIPVSLYAWVGRRQGLIVQKGNPLNIRGLEDLPRSEVSFVNRQRGAGTRVLLDFHLSKLGIPSESVRGYEREEYTHLAVAAAVSSARATCGLGIAAAAQALDLDFIPLFDEEYDLVIPRRFEQTPLLAPLFEIGRSDPFRQAVAALPGYDVSRMGEKLAEVG